MHDAPLAGRTALVTGGGRGIGAACARALGAAGVKVVVAGRTQAEIDVIARELGGVAVRVDLTDRADTDRMLAELAEPGRQDRHPGQQRRGRRERAAGPHVRRASGTGSWS